MTSLTTGLESQTLSDIIAQADRASLMMERIRGVMLTPTARKSSPTYSSGQLGAVCGLDRNQVNYRITKGDLPIGTLGTSGRREFSLADVRLWSRAYRTNELRPEGAEAVTFSLVNFKGGVGKTTTSMSIAQALALRGHKVLAIDCDPQGSLTTLFGILPDTEVEDEHTILPLCVGAETTIRSAIRPTYWDGIDLVCGAPLLFGAEFALPSRQQQEDGFRFWDVLNLGIDDVRNEYDVIVIDTPPSLSYVTINALMASNGFIIPLPPNALDVASASQFWRLFSDLAGQLVERRSVAKEFDFIRVLLSRVDSSDSTATVVRDWIGQTYEGKVMPIEIPKTAVVASAAAELGTAYDIGKYDGNPRTYKRAIEAYDKVTDLVEQLIQATWRRMIGQ